MRHTLILTVFLLLACSGILGTPLEQVERGYVSRITDLTEIETTAVDPDLQKRAREAREKHQAAYAEVPTEDDPRADAIGKINQASRDDIWALQEELDIELAKAADAAEAKAVVERVKLQETWKGRWRSEKHVMNIGADRSVHYENNSGAMKKTIDASVVELTQDELVIGAMGINSRFPIDQQPTKGDDGVRTMKLDGVTYVWLGP